MRLAAADGPSWVSCRVVLCAPTAEALNGRPLKIGKQTGCLTSWVSCRVVLCAPTAKALNGRPPKIVK